MSVRAAAVGVLCAATAACGRVGFDAAPAVAIDAAADARADASAPAPALALEPGFPVLANINSTAGTTITTPKLSTIDSGVLLVAVFVWGTGGTDESPLVVSGAGLTWTPQVQSTFPPGSVPPGTSGDTIWTAWADAPLVDQIVSGTRGSMVESAVMDLGVYAFTGASPTPGATGAFGSQTGDNPLLVTVTATAAGSWILGGFHHGEAKELRVPDANTVFDLTDDPTVAPNGHFQAVGRLAGTTTAPGPVTIGSSTSGTFALTSGIEIVPAP